MTHTFRERLDGLSDSFVDSEEVFAHDRVLFFLVSRGGCS